MRRIELTAPPGKLGVRFTFTTIEGADGGGNRYETTVGWVRPGSPMSGKLLPGDRVISVDGRATAGIDHHALAALIGSLAAIEKKLITASSPQQVACVARSSRDPKYAADATGETKAVWDAGH